jgi:hypothetical protein
MSSENPRHELSVDQLIAICKDLSYTIDIVRVVRTTMSPVKACKALTHRRHYLRDIRILLEASDGKPSSTILGS